MLSKLVRLLNLLPNKDEALLVQEIDKALLLYSQTQGVEYLSYLPESTQQNFSKLNKFCGDIVASFMNISALVLEIKVRKPTGKLSSFSETQLEGLKFLHSRSVPIYYSFNSRGLNDYTKDCENNLEITAAVEPVNIHPDGQYPSSPESLKTVVDKLIGTPPGGGNIPLVLAAMIDPDKSLLNSGIGNMTTEKLLIAYDPSTQSLRLLSREQILHVLRTVFDQKIVARNKSAQELCKAVSQMQKCLKETVAHQKTMSMKG